MCPSFRETAANFCVRVSPRSAACRCPRCSGSVPRPPTPSERTAVIVVWLRGGASHLDTYDPKPDAPAEYRGPFGAIAHADARPARHRAAAAARADLRPLHDPALDGPHRRRAPGRVAATALRRPRPAGQAQARLPRLHERRPPPALRPAPHRCRTTSASTRSSATTTSPSPARPTSASRYAPFAVTGRPERPRPSASRTSASPTAGEQQRLDRRARPAQDASTRSAATSTAPATLDAMDRFQEQALDLLTSPQAAAGLRPEPGEPAGPRPLRPQRLGPATAHGPPAGRGGRGDRHHRR